MNSIGFYSTRIMGTMDFGLFVFLLKTIEYCCFSKRSFPILESLDKFLCNVLEEPAKWTGREVMEAMKLYNWSLTSLRECVLRKDTVVAQTARDLRVQGGPLFLKKKLSKTTLDLMKIDFTWSEDEVQKMLLMRNDVLKNWRVFYKEYRKNKDFYNKFLKDSDMY